MCIFWLNKNFELNENFQEQLIKYSLENNLKRLNIFYSIKQHVTLQTLLISIKLRNFDLDKVHVADVVLKIAKQIQLTSRR